jgi:hypothetical protein
MNPSHPGKVDRAAGHASSTAAIAANPATAIHTEPSTIASGPTATLPSQMHNTVIGAPPTNHLARTSRAPSRRSERSLKRTRPRALT